MFRYNSCLAPNALQYIRRTLTLAYFAQDADIPTKYHTYFMVEFNDPESFDRVPEKGTNVKVEIPVVNRNMSGGIGLAELDGLLESTDYDWYEGSDGLYGSPISVVERSEDKPTRVVELIVQRSSTSTPSSSHCYTSSYPVTRIH